MYKTKLTSDAVKIIVANMNETLYSSTFKFGNVLRQQILGDVVVQLICEWIIERLPKLVEK